MMAVADKVSVIHNLARFSASVEKQAGIQESTGAQMVFGRGAEQIHPQRTAPEGSYP